MPQLSPRKPKLLDQMRDKLRVMYSAWKTEKTYIEREEKFLRFQRDRNQGVRRQRERIHPECGIPQPRSTAPNPGINGSQ